MTDVLETIATQPTRLSKPSQSVSSFSLSSRSSIRQPKSNSSSAESSASGSDAESSSSSSASSSRMLFVGGVSNEMPQVLENPTAESMLGKVSGVGPAKDRRDLSSRPAILADESSFESAEDVDLPFGMDEVKCKTTSKDLMLYREAYQFPKDVVLRLPGA